MTIYNTFSNHIASQCEAMCERGGKVRRCFLPFFLFFPAFEENLGSERYGEIKY